MTERVHTGASALEFLPSRITLSSLREAARGCRGCPLYRNATQTVFGEGPRNAQVVLVGEVPGNDEDLAGHPFVGPAGQILDEALKAARIGRDEIYVTNVVKHFLGATPAQALVSRDFRVTRMRGRVLATALSDQTVATVHPSSVLRQRTSEDRRREMARFVADLKGVARLIRG